jgi:glycerol kinase
MSRYLLAIDQGTTGTTVLAIDETLAVVGRGYAEFAQHFPQPGWVEHEPDEIWASVAAATRECMQRSGVRGEQVQAIGITNQRETTVVWERGTGQAVHRAIVWQCRRTTERCAELKAAGHEDLVRSRTGLVLDPYFSGTKLSWILDRDGLRARARELAFGTVDSFLLWRLTGGQVHATDASNASRTLLMHLEDVRWDPELCGLLNVPMEVLPEIRPSAEVYGRTRGLDFLPDGIPIAGMAGDQQAALFGQACFAIGDAKCTYGTGAFLLINTGRKAVPSEHGLLTTVAWRLGDETWYALEGSAFIAGAAVQWLRDGLQIIDSAQEIEGLARSVDSSGGVVFVPALAGLGAPHWRPTARGLFRGLDRGVGRGQLARAVLEGIALQNVDILRAMESDLGSSLTVLRVDGGAAGNDLLMQVQSDLLERPIARPRVLETTALGAACLAGLGVGLFDGLDGIRQTWAEERRFEPQMAPSLRRDLLAAWDAAVERA